MALIELFPTFLLMSLLYVMIYHWELGRNIMLRTAGVVHIPLQDPNEPVDEELRRECPSGYPEHP